MLTKVTFLVTAYLPFSSNHDVPYAPSRQLACIHYITDCRSSTSNKYVNKEAVDHVTGQDTLEQGASQEARDEGSNQEVSDEGSNREASYEEPDEETSRPASNEETSRQTLGDI